MSVGQIRRDCLARAVGEPFYCALDGLPDEASLAQVEQMLQPLCTGRILMISLHECGKGVVEFEHERDADSCTGTRHLSAKPIRLKRFEPSEKTPLKRQKRWTFPNRETTTAAENKVVARDTGSTASQESLQTKKGRAETKREKARRLNRVGLSYRCGRCGQPKKGHVCHLAEGETWDGQTAAGVKEPEFDEKPKSLSWDLDSEALFKDIKSVLSKPMTPVSVKGSASEHIYDRPMESDSVVAGTFQPLLASCTHPELVCHRVQ